MMGTSKILLCYSYWVCDAATGFETRCACKLPYFGNFRSTMHAHVQGLGLRAMSQGLQLSNHMAFSLELMRGLQQHDLTRHSVSCTLYCAYTDTHKRLQ